jgi:hypothetical protein
VDRGRGARETQRRGEGGEEGLGNSGDCFAKSARNDIVRASAPMHHSAAPDPNYDAGRWWQTEEGLVAVVNEVIKLGFY